MEVSERNIMGQEECRSLQYEIIMRKEIIEMENADKVKFPASISPFTLSLL